MNDAVTTIDVAKKQVRWRLQPAPPGIVWQSHKFSIIDAIEAASQLLATDYTKETETLTTGRSGGTVIGTLPQLVSAALTPQRTMQVENGKGVMGQLGRWKVYWTPDTKMQDLMVLEKSGAENSGGEKVEILIVRI